MNELQIEQGSQEWHQARAGIPTASAFSRFCTSSGEFGSAWKSYAHSLMCECFGDYDPDEAWEGNAATRRGHRLEPEARDEFAMVTGLRVRAAGFCLSDDGLSGCSPDGLIEDNADNVIAGLEIKCHNREKHAALVLAGQVPTEHIIQVHGSLVVTGLPTWYFMAYHPSMRPLIVRVDRDGLTNVVAANLGVFTAKYRDYYTANFHRLQK